MGGVEIIFFTAIFFPPITSLEKNRQDSGGAYALRITSFFDIVGLVHSMNNGTVTGSMGIVAVR